MCLVPPLVSFYFSFSLPFTSSCWTKFHWNSRLPLFCSTSKSGGPYRVSFLELFFLRKPLLCFSCRKLELSHSCFDYYSYLICHQYLSSTSLCPSNQHRKALIGDLFCPVLSKRVRVCADTPNSTHASSFAHSELNSFDSHFCFYSCWKREFGSLFETTSWASRKKRSELSLYSKQRSAYARRGPNWAATRT